MTLETRAEELSRGTLFAGRYEIIEELGKGGMGKVYRVEDVKVKEEVALKLIKSDIASDKRTIERFSNELKMARKIRHKNVCAMYDLGEEKGIYYITMEYVPGEDLKSFIRRAGPLNAAKAIFIAKQVCEGLTEAHRLGVIHRDLKPGNIMIDREGNARIMDFGIARSLKTKGTTGSGVIIGTPEYMSPEQVDQEEVDQRSDIYSLGVILYEMVTGRVPFEGETPLLVAIKHKNEIPKDPKELNHQIPDDLSRLILRCLEKDRERRYGSAEELWKRLNTIFMIRPTEEVEAKRTNSIAVLPFADLSPHGDQEYFCDGLTEELINTLTKIEELQVASRTSSFQFKGKGHSISEIGRNLKVQTVLEGSVRKAGNRIRITTQLINVADGYQLWAEKYDRNLEDIFSIQDEISQAIVEKLKVRLFLTERQKLRKHFTEDLEAYNLYLKGRHFVNKRTGEGIRRSIDLFLQAVERDPKYAMAYQGLAEAYTLLSYYSSFPPKEAFPKGKEAAAQALKIDNTLAEAHAILGVNMIMHDFDWAGGEEELKKALVLNPNHAMAHFWYGWYFLWRGRFDEAVERMKHAQKLEPLSLVINCEIGLAYYFARQYNRSIEQYQKTLDIDPDYSYYPHLYRGWTYLQKSLYEEALAEFEKEKEIKEGWDPVVVETWMGIAYTKQGNRVKGQEILSRLLDASRRYTSPYHIALLNFALGREDEGFQWLDKAYEERDYWLCWLKIEPLFDDYRDSSRYISLLKKVGLD
jgi:serine/threonine protein kinase/lipoprotein NlpI